MPKNNCAPQNVYGPYRQTIFLGCSVLSFSASAGWNGSASEVTVELAPDPCASPAGHYKEYWANSTVIFPTAQQWTAADPGFTEPNIGAPAYFRVADFEYTGLIQSWTIKEGADGSPIYTVKLVDPRPILDHTQLILDSYEGSVQGMYNLLNVYGYLEYTDNDCQDQIFNGTGFGAPALGFGGSRRTERGLPWDLVKKGIQDLAGSIAGTPNQSFGMGGLHYRPGSGRGWGELGVGTSTSARYAIDIEEIPNSYTWDYRIQGPTSSLSEIINGVCEDAGCDYYVELLPTAGHLIIKYRTISRTNQPSLGTSEIQSFVLQNNILQGGAGIISDSFGREMRSEVNSSFLIGAKARQYYEETDVDNMTPFWGWDADGELIESKYAVAGADGGNGWEVKLDVRKVNLALHNPINLDVIDNKFIWVNEIELRLALGDQTKFQNYVSQQTVPGGNTPISRYFRETCHNRPEDVKGKDPAAGNAAANIKLGLANGEDAGDASKKWPIDMGTFFNWLSSYASDFYGKQFLVKVPYFCADTDPDTGQIIYSDLPSPEGGWPSIINAGNLSDKSTFLDITNGTSSADFFKDEQGKVQPILRYFGDDINTEALNQDEFLINGDYLWLKADLHDVWVTGNPNQGGSDFVAPNKPLHSALLKVSSAVLEKPLTPPGMANIVDVEPKKADTAKPNIADVPENLGGQGPIVGSISPPAYWPFQAGVPTLSNTRTYGPWYKTGANPGSVACNIDDGLAPWEYGGITPMIAAAVATVTNAVTSMQVAERGEVSIPGYPVLSLGSALLGSPPNWRYDGRTLGVGMNSYPAGSAPHHYVNWAVGQSSAGASVSNINVTVAAGGVTTSYTISTFTPVFGRFSKGNADRIKQLGLARFKAERDRRAKNALKRLLKAAQNRARKMAGENIGQGGLLPKSAGVWFAGKLLSDPKRKIVLAPTASTMPYYQDYENTAAMTMDGLMRPVSNYGSASLPKINTNSASCASQPTQSQGPHPPVRKAKAGNAYTPLPIEQKFLDFLADPTSNAAFINDDRAYGSSKGHDIEGVARESSTSDLWDGDSDSAMIHSGAQTDYASDYRYLALRGPLVIHGWGYDLHGKPIPNAVGDSAGSYQSNQNGLKDVFKANWLEDARDWPVAPVDLRFDRKRGVWTIPPAFRIYQATADSDISEGGAGSAMVTKYVDDMYDEDGVKIDTPYITVNNPADCEIESGDKILAYYDTAACEYWAIPMCGSGGSGSPIEVKCTEECASGCEPGAFEEINYLEFGKNICVDSGNEGNDGHLRMSAGISATKGSFAFTGCESSSSFDDSYSGCAYHTLEFGEGLQISGADADCGTLSIAAMTPKIKDSGCAFTRGNYAPYNKLVISSGLFLSYHDDCEFSIRGPEFGSDPCSGDAIAPQSFEEIVFGSGLSVSESGDCGLVISGPKAGSTADCGATAIEPKPFDELLFASGLTAEASGECAIIVSGPKFDATGCTNSVEEMGLSKLSVTTGIWAESEEDCVVTLSGPRISDYECDHAYVEDMVRLPFHSLLLGTGLTLNKDVSNAETPPGQDDFEEDCDLFIHTNLKVVEETCDGSDGVQGQFETLYFSGLPMEEMDGCGEYRITGPKIRGTDCGHDEVDEFVAFTGLTFGSGLELIENEDCDYTVYGPKVAGDGSCGSDAVQEESFSLLTFSTGLVISKTGDCEYVVTGPKVQGIDCGNDVEATAFTGLKFGSGLELVKTADCDYTVYGPKIGMDSCGRTLELKSFTEIQITSGLKLTPSGECGYTLGGPQVGGADDCDNYLEPGPFTGLFFGSGLEIVKNKECDYTVYGPKIGMDSCDRTLEAESFTVLQITSGLTLHKSGDCAYTLGGPQIMAVDCDSEMDPEPFTGIKIGSGLTLKKESNCEFHISGPKIELDSCGLELDAEPFEKLTFVSGLSMTKVAGDGCDYEVGGPMIQSESCAGSEGDVNALRILKISSGLTMTSKGDCVYSIGGPKLAMSNCGASMDADHFEKLTMSTGITLNKNSSCDYSIAGPKVKGTSPVGTNVALNHFNTIEFTDGLTITKVGDCDYKVAGSGATGLGMKMGAATCEITEVCTGVDCLTIGSGLTYTRLDKEVTVVGPKLYSTVDGLPIPTTDSFFDKLTFGSGLIVTGTNCDWTVHASGGMKIGRKDDVCEQPELECEEYDCIYVSTGLWFDKDTTELRGGPKWNQTDNYHCTAITPADGFVPCAVSGTHGLDVHMTEEEVVLIVNTNKLTSDEDVCHIEDAAQYDSAIIANEPTQNLVMGLGLQKRGSYHTTDHKCKTLLTTQFDVGPMANVAGCSSKPCTSPITYGDNVVKIGSLSCGGKFTMKASATECHDGIYSQVLIGPNGIDAGFTVVTGVICSGDTLAIQTMNLSFCDGLLMGTAPTVPTTIA